MKTKVFYNTLLLVSIITIFMIGTGKLLASTSLLQLQVTSAGMSISASGILNLGSITTSVATGTLSGQYAATAFWVTDGAGSTGGYTTTIQSTDLTGSFQGTTKSISGTNIYMKAGGNPILMGGQANPNVTLSMGVNSGNYISIGSAQTYFFKNATATGSVISVYGDRPWIKIDIPPYQVDAAYQGTLIFTLTAG